MEIIFDSEKPQILPIQYPTNGKKSLFLKSIKTDKKESGIKNDTNSGISILSIIGNGETKKNSFRFSLFFTNMDAQQEKLELSLNDTEFAIPDNCESIEINIFGYEFKKNKLTLDTFIK